MPNRLLLLASESNRLERLIATSPRTKRLVSRFVAGTTLAEAVQATKELNARRIDVTFDLLGETVEHLEEAEVALQGYLDAVHAIAEQCPGSTLSVKLSQLGIGLDPAVCAGHLKALIEAAREVNVLLEIDMEHSSVGGATLEGFRHILDEHPCTRVAIQAAMRRTPSDLLSFQTTKPRIRLVKGAFLETRDRALLDRQEITAQYLYLTDWALQNLPDPAFGTHDDVCIDHAKKAATKHGVDRSNYEFQMLYGVRRDLQQKLADEGYRIRVYLPYGTDWYPYLMRRMAEKPANLLLFLRSLVSG
jgi:proline dehydrogenase